MEKITPLFKICEGCRHFDEYIECGKKTECELTLKKYLESRKRLKKIFKGEKK